MLTLQLVSDSHMRIFTVLCIAVINMTWLLLTGFASYILDIALTTMQLGLP